MLDLRAQIDALNNIIEKQKDQIHRQNDEILRLHFLVDQRTTEVKKWAELQVDTLSKLAALGPKIAELEEELAQKEKQIAELQLPYWQQTGSSMESKN